MCFGVISLWVSGKFTLFGDEQTTLKDIKAPSLGPGAAAASERAAILDHFWVKMIPFMLPRVKRANKYMMMCREISQNHFYIVDGPRRNSGQGPSEEHNWEPPLFLTHLVSSWMNDA